MWGHSCVTLFVDLEKRRLLYLHIAADWSDDIAIIEALLAAGADPREETEEGNRPVDLAWDIRSSAAW